jgi:hypothetical protein
MNYVKINPMSLWVDACFYSSDSTALTISFHIPVLPHGTVTCIDFPVVSFWHPEFRHGVAEVTTMELSPHHVFSLEACLLATNTNTILCEMKVELGALKTPVVDIALPSLDWLPAFSNRFSCPPVLMSSCPPALMSSCPPALMSI